MTAFESTLETGLDFTRESFTEPEAAGLIKWYQETHGEGDMSLNLFADFLIKYDGGGIKAFRRNAIELSTPDSAGDALPPAFFNLLYLHLYAVLFREKETLYEIISCKVLGVSKAETLETIRLAYITGGPSGINAIAERGRRYLDEWVEDEPKSVLRWPEGWRDADLSFETGLSRSSAEFAAGELDALRQWHRHTSGEVPAYVAFLEKVAPTALKTMRLRTERLGESLPPQAHLLMLLHLAAYQVWPTVLRRVLQQGLSMGVTRYQALQAILSGALIGGEWKTEAVLEPVLDLLSDER